MVACETLNRPFDSGGPPDPLHRSLWIHVHLNRERRRRRWIDDLNFAKEGGVCSLAVLLKGCVKALHVA